RDDANLEKNALASAAITDGRVAVVHVRVVFFHAPFLRHESCDRRRARRAVPLQLSTALHLRFRRRDLALRAATSKCILEQNVSRPPQIHFRRPRFRKVSYSIRCTNRRRNFHSEKSGCRTNQRARICALAVDFSAFSKQEVLEPYCYQEFFA